MYLHFDYYRQYHRTALYAAEYVMRYFLAHLVLDRAPVARIDGVECVQRALGRQPRALHHFLTLAHVHETARDYVRAGRYLTQLVIYRHYHDYKAVL